jgi:hypothetical protein
VEQVDFDLVALAGFLSVVQRHHDAGRKEHAGGVVADAGDQVDRLGPFLVQRAEQAAARQKAVKS